MNIIAKQDGHATVASCASQYRHCGASVEIDAPHIGQLIVPASIERDSNRFELCTLRFVLGTLCLVLCAWRLDRLRLCGIFIEIHYEAQGQIKKHKALSSNYKGPNE
jgi:hypothetical protein